MNLRHIEIIHAIVQHGSVSGAARALHVSQPNVTRVLAHAEQQIGFRLFERTTQGLSPTPEALRLMPEIENLMRQRSGIDSLVAQLKRGDAQHLRIGAAHALGQVVLPPLLMTAHEQMPELTIELTTGHWDTLCDSLLRQQIDFALVFNQRSQTGIMSEVVAQHKLVALLPLGSVQRESMGLDELGPSPLLMQPQDPLGSLLHAALDAQDINLSSPWLIKSYTVIAEMVAAGAGIGVVDAYTAEHYRDKVITVPLEPTLYADVALISLERQNLSLPAQHLCELIRQHFKAERIPLFPRKKR